MANNFPGPYEIEMFYTVSTFLHIARYNCDLTSSPSPGTPMTSINFKTRGGVATPAIPTAMASWIALIDNIYNTAASFDSYNLWQYAPLTTERTFISSDTLGINGASASVTNKNQQLTLTFRTVDGDGMRIVFLDSISTSEIRIPYVNLGVDLQLIMDFVDSDANWILARDTSYAIAKLSGIGGENEALFKRRNR